MSWNLCRWVWRVASPLFVGSTPSGALNRCRLYVPARPLWGALTAELARQEASGDPDYAGIGEMIRDHTRLSYLYPAEVIHGGWCAWLPQYREGEGLCWVREDNDAHRISDRRFRRRLLWARSGTAIVPDSDSAREGSLRETECVQPFWRQGDDSQTAPVEPVAMAGYILFKESGPEERIRPIARLFVGGDTRYGLGRLERESMEPAATFFGMEVELDQDEPRVVAEYLPAHAHDTEADLSGNQEAIGGWDMAKGQCDPRISGPVWMPGSRWTGDADIPAWNLQPTGMLRMARAEKRADPS
ncbi:conserved protein of unknown function [Methylacidimicrobium sp. AP8]|uniref:hypothetical protein n=1 Tax=Methylacidimicrobium sp. AP8 TaxID=2730359 RepID=UPI0018C12C16|nr:hypothetical protein [Methylacidimicrobium sp. AP8]CAB4243738.1 conserved protein of unknown function [Methylacidimicrobium sp. AP8]